MMIYQLPKPEDDFPPALLKLVQKNDLQSLLLSLSDSGLEERIKALLPNNSFRLDKIDSGLARTITILCAPNGEIIFIIETENLDAQNKICEVEEFDGLIKKGMPAWRLDGTNGAQKYASLYIKLSDAKKFNPKSKQSQKILTAIQKEVAFTWSLPENPYILRSVLGPIFSNEQGTFVSVYSPYGTRLDDLDRLSLSEKKINDIITKILEGLVFLEKSNIIHGDIKSSNVLVFFDEKKEVGSVKFIDFGTICSINGNAYQHKLHATPGYESPEIALMVSDVAHPDHAEYEAVYAEPEGKNYAKKCADKMVLNAQSKERYSRPHPKNDVWASAVMIHEFLHGEFLDKEPKEQLLKGMMDPDRDKRFNASSALAAWKKQELRNSVEEAPQRHFLPGFMSIQRHFSPENFIEKAVNFCSQTVGSFKRLLGHGN